MCKGVKDRDDIVFEQFFYIFFINHFYNTKRYYKTQIQNVITKRKYKTQIQNVITKRKIFLINKFFNKLLKND